MKEDTGNYLKKLVIILDTGILGLITNPRRNPVCLECQGWFKSIRATGVKVTTSEVCDYEIRRELIRAGKQEGLERLNQFRETFGCIPVTTNVFDKAAELWAWARNTRQATASEESIDADVILCAQSIIISNSGKSGIIVTTNVKHLDRYTPSLHWRSATLENCVERCSKTETDIK